MADRSDDWWSESGDRLRAFIESAPRKMWVNRLDGTVEFFNREWRRYAGHDGVTDGASWKDLIHPDDSPRVEAIRAHAVEAGERYDVQVRLLQASDGGYRWHQASVAPVTLGSEIIAWIGAATDVDDRFRAEAALQESETVFRTMANAIPQLAWMYDPRNEECWFNQRWLDYTGKSEGQMQADGWQASVHPDEVAALKAEIDASRAVGESWECTCQLQAADGDYNWFLLRANPIRDAESGEVSRWFATGTDIDEQRQLQERQRLLTQEVSHRVKNSLAIIASLLALQARDAKDDDTSRTLFDAYSRVQTVADVHDHLWRPSDARVTEISAFLGELCLRLGETTPDHQVNFEGDEITLPTDRAVPIGLLVNELVTNALKYAYRDGGPVFVGLSGPADGRLTLKVSDRGAGLPEGFDLHAPSASLGMRLIANTVRQLGAEIAIADARPGTSFTISIPHQTP